MGALPFVLLAAAIFLAALALLALRPLRLAVPFLARIAAAFAVILALLAIIAEAPRAGAELWGTRLPGTIVATQESLRLESVRASNQRSSHYTPRHRFGAMVCYRAPGTPGFGAAPLPDPAIQAAIGEAPTEPERRCRATPGDGIPRTAEIRLTEAAHDAARPGQPVTLHVWRPLGLLEWTWIDGAPLLPWLPRPAWGAAPAGSFPAEIVAITIDPRGRTLLNRRAHDYAVPIAHVRLRYTPPNHAQVEGIDTVDAPSVAHLAPGHQVTIALSAAAPRAPHLHGASRSYWWRNQATDLAIVAALLAAVAAVIIVWRRRAKT